MIYTVRARIKKALAGYRSDYTMNRTAEQIPTAKRHKVVTFRVDQPTYKVLLALLAQDRADKPFDFVSQSSIIRRLILTEGHRLGLVENGS